ncbi:hypothetical protein ED733_002221 [Metarhizium rileyi]|uniref:Thioredoxin-like fold protein n=1 Tax=Metarhizium rileyi (strain RCEF 4871) TaxID=1649241 RepID=A0A5C6GB25_METRR|nr:hypothetical protein ED733_002221 [Metarhizium rileyi]
MTTYSTDPALYIFTSLTAGSSHIVTATSRLETILRANRVPFKAVDIATDEKARMLWGRRAGKDEGGRLRKLPGLVQEGLVVGDLVEIEDWNEYGELKQHVKIHYDEHTIPNINNKPPEPIKPSKPATKPAVASNAAAASKAAPSPPAPPPMPEPKAATEAAAKPKDDPAESGKQTTLPLRSVADEAAQKAKELRLKSLRNKVHGTKAEDGLPESSSQTNTTEPTPENGDEEKNADATETKPTGLQSPTSTAWKDKSGGGARETVQSPTSGRWRPNSVDVNATRAGSEDTKMTPKEQVVKKEPEIDTKTHEKDGVEKKNSEEDENGGEEDDESEAEEDEAADEVTEINEEDKKDETKDVTREKTEKTDK